MVGVNGFYDRDWARTLDRTGADAELRWRSFNLSTNYYAGQTEDCYALTLSQIDQYEAAAAKRGLAWTR